MRQIDADVLKATFDERYDDAFMQSHTRPNIAWWEGYSAGVNWGRNTIADAPTVDAVEVVRCKGCIHYKPERVCRWDEEKGEWDRETIVVKPFGECTGQNLVFSEDAVLTVGENDFCSCGEREDND